MGCSAGTQVKNDKMNRSSELNSKRFTNLNTSNTNITKLKLNSKSENKDQNKKHLSKHQTEVICNFEDEIGKLLSIFNKNFNYFSVKLCKLSVYKLKCSSHDELDRVSLFTENKYYLVKGKVEKKYMTSEINEKISNLFKDISSVSNKYKKTLEMNKGIKLLEKLKYEFKIICINDEKEKTVNIGSEMDYKLILLFFDIINNEALEKIKQLNDSINSNKLLGKFSFYPIMNYFYKQEDFSFQKKYLEKIGFQNINVYLPMKDDSLIDLFGLDNLITSRIFLIDQIGEVKFIGESYELTEDEINFYLNINLDNLSLNKDSNTLGKYNLFDKTTFNIMKQNINNNAEEIKRLSLASNLDYTEIKISKVKLLEENRSNIYFPIKVNLLYKSIDSKQPYKLRDFISKEMKNYFLFERIKLNEKESLENAVKLINSELVKNFTFYIEGENVIEKRKSKTYHKNNKSLFGKSSNLLYNFKLINTAFQEKSVDLQNFLSDLIYSNPNIIKVGLRYSITPKEGLQYKRIIKGYKDQDGNSNLNITSKHFSANKKFFFMINTNVLYLEETVKNSIMDYIDYLSENQRKLDIDLFFIIIGLNAKEANKIKQVFSLEKRDSYFWFMTSSSFAEFNFYNEDFSIIAIILDNELKLQYIEEIQNMRKECYENTVFAKKDVLKHLLYYSKKIEKENFNKIQLKFDSFCEQVNDKSENIHNIIPCCLFSYTKILKFAKCERKKSFYKNCFIDIKLPDYFLESLKEDLDEFVYEISKLDEEFGIYVGKSIHIYETTKLNLNEFKRCKLCKESLDLNFVYYCYRCEDTYCEPCEEQLNNVNKENNIQEKSLKHKHNLILISIKEKLESRQFFIYTMLLDNYINTNSNTKSYKKCCLCENYIYPEDKVVYLNLAEITNGFTYSEQFVCNNGCFKELQNESGQKSEEFLQNVNKNRINRKNLVFLKIYWELDN